MAKTLTFTLTDDQQSSLDRYIALPQFCPWAFSEETKQNEPTRKYPTIESFLQEKYSGLLDTVVRACPPASVQTKLDAIKVLQDEIAVSTAPENLISESI